QAQYLALLRDLQREYGLALIFITHNLGIVARMCDRVAVMYAGRFVEAGSVREIFDAPAHPYTRGLLDAIPRLAHRAARPTAIPGAPRARAEVRAGCAFAPRCRQALERCGVEAPPAFGVGDGHYARCWLAESGAR